MKAWLNSLTVCVRTRVLHVSSHETDVSDDRPVNKENDYVALTSSISMSWGPVLCMNVLNEHLKFLLKFLVNSELNSTQFTINERERC